MVLLPAARTVTTLGVAALGVLSLSISRPCAAQERVEREVRVTRAPGGIIMLGGEMANRAVIGVTLADASRADTAGVRLEEVERDGPAGKAGLKAGDLLVGINGVDLRVSREDADDAALAALGQRRLQRELGKVTPGDAVRLEVQSGANTRTVTVTTVSAAERRRGDARGMIGVNIGSAGNARDTLGLFVSGVTASGPAEKAGIIEGERIAAVNGVDVRVPRADIDDAPAASARVDRFVREVQRLQPGQTVTLRVWGNGRYREVPVTVAAAAATPGEPMRFEFRRDGPRGRVRINDQVMEFDGQGIERAMEEMGRRLQERLRDVEIDVRGLRMLPERAGAVRLRTMRTAL